MKKYKLYGLCLMFLGVLLFALNALNITFNIPFSYILFYVFGFILFLSGGAITLKSHIT